MATYSSTLPVRAQVLHTAVIVLGFTLAGVAVLLAVSGGTGGALTMRTGAGIPFGALLLVALPAAAWLYAQTLTLSRFGGAINATFDPAVLAFLGWVAAGALAAGGRGIGEPSTGQLLGLGSWALLAWLGGLGVAEVLAVDRHLVVRLFNVGLAAAGGAAFLLVAASTRGALAHLLTGDAANPQFGPWDVAAVLTATLAYHVTTLLLTALSIAWSEREPLREVLSDESGLVAAAVVVAVAGIGVMAAVLLMVSVWALTLLAPVIAGIAFAGRVGTQATSEHRRSEALFDAAARCQQTDNTDEVLAAVVDGARAATGTEGAQMRTTPPEPGELGSPVDAGGVGRWLVVPVRKSGNSFLPADHRVLHTLATLARQSLARIAAGELVRDAAERDALTGLANRPTFMAALAEEASVSQATGRPVSVLFLDMDGFKQINDTYGHRAGDDVLVAVARRCQAALRPNDLVARLGGDEFAVLLRDTGAEEMRQVTERLERALFEPVALAGRVLHVGVSIGSASAEVLDDHHGAERLLEAADASMYAHKTRRHPRRVQRHAPTATTPSTNPTSPRPSAYRQRSAT